MVPVRTLSEVRAFLRGNLARDRVTLIGFVFVPPNTDTGRQLLACINEFHYRFGPDVHFFFAGWSRWVPAEQLPQDATSIAAPDGGEPWLYSAELFSRMIDDLGAISKYRWGGGPEFLLVGAYTAGDSVVIDFASSVPLHIDEMLQDHAVTSIGQLLERSANEGRRRQQASIDHFSDINGAKAAATSLMEGVLEALPLHVGSTLLRVFRRTRHYAVRNLAAG